MVLLERRWLSSTEGIAAFCAWASEQTTYKSAAIAYEIKRDAWMAEHEEAET